MAGFIYEGPATCVTGAILLFFEPPCKALGLSYRGIFMKNFFRKSVLGLLNFLAGIRLKRLKLFVIGVTGSVGKTSAKEAIFTILSTRYNVFRSNKSYNTEFGLPLAILEQQSGFSSPWKWAGVIFGSFWKAFFAGGKMQMLVVEMGTDKPGDMVDLLKLVKPQVGVMTGIKPVHLGEGQFKDMDDIFAEKKKLVEFLPEKAYAVLDADDPFIVTLKDKLACRKIFYGRSEAADLRALEVKNTEDGLAFTVSYKDQVAQGVVPILGDFHISVLLAAIGVALTQGFTLEEAAKALANFKLPPGRMNPIAGLNDALIIDSSYNSSPETVKVALDTLKDFEGRKIAVLGNMNELGTYSEQLHRAVGKYTVGRTDLLVTVGESAKQIGDEAVLQGFPAERVMHYADALAAAESLKQKISRGDVLLVKGSQNKVRLEKLVKILMKEPWQAVRLLARQGREWEKIE
jgi:UDP-N-acetylmuramyl pentapeptide synthase